MNYWPLLQSLYDKNKTLLSQGIVDEKINNRIDKIEKCIVNWGEYYKRLLYVSYTTFWGMLLTLPQTYPDKLSFEVDGQKFRCIRDTRQWRKFQAAYLSKISVMEGFEREVIEGNMKVVQGLWERSK